MNQFAKQVLSLAAVTALSASAYAADPTYQELRQQVQSMQARLDSIEAKQLNARDVDQTVERVLRDANQRSQLLAAGGGFTAGYDKGFFLKSDDGSFSLRPGLLFQFRNITNYRGGGNDDVQNGFEIRRLRPRIDGNAFGPDLTYSFVWDTARSGGSVALLDAFVQYRIAKDWAIKAGQFRESWYHEGDNSDAAQLAVERSMVDGVLAGSVVDRVQGVSLIYGGNKDQAVRAEVTFHDGANSKNTDFRDVQPGATPGDPPTYSADFGAGARLEYKVFGDWADYKDFTAKSGKQDLLVLGGGVDWTENGDLDIYRTTVDAQWENGGALSVYGALNGNFSRFGTVAAGADDSRFDWGALAQAGYLIRPQWEVFGRYDVVGLDSDFVTGDSTFNELTAGVNYYLGADGKYFHRAKLTLDLTYLPDGTPSNLTGADLLSNGGDEEWVLRAQFQIML